MNQQIELLQWEIYWKTFFSECIRGYQWPETIVGQVDLTTKLCFSFCFELQSAKSTYQHVDLDLY